MSDDRDETRQFSPFDDETDGEADGTTRAAGQAAGALDDQTRAMPASPAGALGDQTRAAPVSSAGALDDQTRAMPASPAGSLDDQTRAVAATPPDVAAGRRPPADATSVLPPADDWAASRVNPAWAGRAEVRAPRPGGPQYEEEDWSARPMREPRDRWWMPILIGFVVLVLLGALGWGIYLIVQNSGTNDTPAPAATSAVAPQPAVTTETVPATTEPTTAPTTTSPPTTTPSTPDPTGAVLIPALKGRSLAEAQLALNSLGLNYRMIYHTVKDVPPDTVIDSDPIEGQEVPPDTRVTLVIAAQPQSTAPSSPSTAVPDQPDN